MGFNTELLHGTKTGDPVTGATLTPVYQSSAFFQPSAEQHEKLFHNKAAGYSYTRINNPTIAAFEERMTVLEIRTLPDALLPPEHSEHFCFSPVLWHTE